MARVAVAYVEVRPDLKGFGTKLKGELQAARKTAPVKVQVEADSKAVKASIAKVSKEIANQPVTLGLSDDFKLAEQHMKAMSSEQAAYIKQYAIMRQNEIIQHRKNEEQSDAAIAKAKVDKEKQLFAVSSNLAKYNAKVKEDLAKADLAREKQFATISANLAQYNNKIKEDRDKEFLARQKSRMIELFAEDRRLFFLAEKQKETDRTAFLKRQETRMKELFAEDRRLFFRDEKEKLAARKRFEDYNKRAAAQSLAIEQRRIQEVRKAFNTVAGSIGNRSIVASMAGTVVRAMGAAAAAATKYAPKITKGLVSGFAKLPEALSGVSKLAGKAIGEIGSEMAGAAASSAGVAIETVESVAGAAVQTTAKATSKMAANAVGATSQVVASSVEMGAASAATAAEITEETGGVGGLIVAMLALAGGMVVVVVGAGAVQVALGGILAVVIPLIAGITALIAEFVALGAVLIGGGLAGLPAVIGAAVAAFGPLMFVASEFQKLFENTAKHTGELFVVMQRLKNAIFAVISSGFIQAITRFVAKTLPLFTSGLVAVASAWNRLLLGLVKFASMPATIASINNLLQMGAQLVDFFAQSINVVVPALLTMATVAGPAFTQILDSVSGLVSYFGAWVTQMAASGQMAVFFQSIADILDQTLGLTRVIVPLMTGWMNLMIGPAGQFLTLLTNMVGQWALFVNSAAGASLISGFFTAMNQIMVTLVPLVNQVFIRFLQFGQVLADLNTAATPALQAIVDILFNLLTQIAPGIERFLQIFTNNLQDPRTQAQLKAIGNAILRMMDVFGSMQNLTAFLTALQTAIVLVNALVMSADVLEILFVGAINSMIDVLNGFIGILDQAIGAYNNTVGRVTGTLDTVGSVAHLKLGLIANDSQNMGNTAANAFGIAAQATTSFANSDAWGALLSNIGSVTSAFGNLVEVGAKSTSAIQTQLNFAKSLYKQAPTASNFKELQYWQNRLNKSKAADTKLATGTFQAGYSAPVKTALSTIGTTAGKKAGGKTAAGFISTFVPAISKLSTYDLLKGYRTGAINSVREVASYLAKGVTSGAANIQKVSNYLVRYYSRDLNAVLAQSKAFYADLRKYAAAVPKLAKNIAGFTNMDQITNYLAGQRSYWEDRLQEIKDFQAKVKDTLTAKSTMVGLFGFIPTPAEVKSELDQQLATMSTFISQLNALKDAGLSTSLYKAWLEAGPEQAGNIVAGLQAATTQDIDEINKKYATLGTTADTALTNAASKAFPIGQSTIEGYIAGIKSMQSELSKALVAAMKQGFADAKKAIKSKSPSQLYAGLGVNSMLGYINGVTSKAGAVATSVADVLGQAAGVRGPALSPGTFSSPMFAGSGIGQPVPPVFNVKVYIGDRDITDIVRIEHQRADENQARVLLAGRRGG